MNECSEYMHPHLNIHNSFTRSHVYIKRRIWHLKSQCKSVLSRSLICLFWILNNSKNVLSFIDSHESPPLSPTANHDTSAANHDTSTYVWNMYKEAIYIKIVDRICRCVYFIRVCMWYIYNACCKLGYMVRLFLNLLYLKIRPRNNLYCTYLISNDLCQCR
jgi:hypothetical protein